jgi:iron complex outermembrane receptor protein
MATTSIYRITKLNVLVPDPEPGSTLLVTLGEVRSKGWEIDAIGAIAANWSVTANYANNETIITEDPRPAQVGSRFPNAPKHSGSFWTRYDIESIALGLAAGATYVDERETFDPTILPAYTAWDAAIFYDWRNYKLALNIKNLTDKRFFSGGYNGYQLWPGMPRTVQLTLRATL